jgi:hypothetical protein
MQMIKWAVSLAYRLRSLDSMIRVHNSFLDGLLDLTYASTERVELTLKVLTVIAEC